jgi:amino acid transporter
MSLKAELTAAADLTSFWDTRISPAVWISVCLVVAIGINALGVGR